MKKHKTKEQLHEHRRNSIHKIDSYLESLIQSEDYRMQSKADKLCYWLNDWTRFLDFESRFNATSLKRYKRGEIIKVHLGFNVGSEEGGLHYAVVVENDNPKSSPVLTIVPLTSVKPDADTDNMRNGNVYLGNELYYNLILKISTVSKQLLQERESLQDLLDHNPSDETIMVINKKQKELYQELLFLEQMRTESKKMKIGSIALTNQITTISKIRIYDPKTDHNILSGIKLSPYNMDLIDQEIIKKYTKNKA